MTTLLDRTTRALRLSEPVREAIVALLALERWTASGGTSAALSRVPEEDTLDLAQVVAAEEAAGGRLSDDVLALIAAGPDGIGEWRIALDRIGGYTQGARDAGCPAELIAIGREGPLFLCVAARPAPDAPVAVTLFDGADRSRTTLGLAEWLQEELEAWLDDLELSEAQVEELVSDSNREQLWPRLAPPAAVAAVRRRVVRHKVFGRGVVVGETLAPGGTKLEVEFDEGGRKVLLERFVEPVEE